MRFGSVCSGIEAASVAWHPLGWQAAWLAEIEPFPSAVLAHHYPDVLNLGDMTKLPDLIRKGEVEAPDLFCGGTPCQAFSVAGLRKSLHDARGNLSLTFCEIANAIDHVRSARGEQPCIVFWENVPGVLSTKDNAFGCFLAGLAGEDAPLEPAGGKWTSAGAVLGGKRAVAWRVLDAQFFGVAQRRRRVFVVASARNNFDPAAVLFEFDGVRRDTAPSRQAGEATAASAGAGATFSCGGIGSYDASDAAATLLKTGQDLGPGCEAIITMAHGQGGAEIATDRAPTLTCNHEAPIAFHPTQDPITSEDGTTHCMGTGSSQGSATVAVAAFKYTMGAKAHGIGYAEEQSPTLDTRPESNAVFSPPMQVRRLTPVECERLQGFPDGYTNIPWRGKPESPDGPRYKALGNSWAVPVVRWIGARIEGAMI